MTEIELLQGIFVMQFLTFIVAIGAFFIYAISKDKENEKRNNEKLESKIKDIIKDENEKNRL